VLVNENLLQIKIVVNDLYDATLC